MMNKETFANEVLELLKKELGCGYQVDVKTVVKNNNLVLTGLIIRKCNNAMGVTLYLDEYYRDYKHGRPMENVVEHIVYSYSQATVKEDFNLQFLESKDEFLKRVAYRIINRDMNTDFLSQCPHTNVAGDLEKMYFVHVNCDKEGFGSVSITHSLMERFDVSMEELEYHAGVNTPQFFPVEFCSMADVLKGFFGECEELTSGLGMWILSNNTKTYGASTLLYEGLLKQISGTLNSDLYIIPSSVHELIILRATEDCDKLELGMMIREVNQTEVRQEERLSDTLYFFNMTTNQLSVA